MSAFLTGKKAIDEAIQWLEQAESDYSGFNDEVDGMLPELREALPRFPAAYAALKAIAEPILSQIEAEEAQYAREEARYGEAPS